MLVDLFLTPPSFDQLNQLNGFFFRRLFNRDSCVDLEFVCRDGVVKCHKMVVAAHSTFIRNILLGCGDEEPVCQIRLPDFSRSSVETLMEYLYKGKLEAPTSQKSVLRDLFVDILKIDPTFGSTSTSAASDPGNVKPQTAVVAVKQNSLKVRWPGVVLRTPDKYLFDKFVHACLPQVVQLIDIMEKSVILNLLKGHV